MDLEGIKKHAIAYESIGEHLLSFRVNEGAEAVPAEALKEVDGMFQDLFTAPLSSRLGGVKQESRYLIGGDFFRQKRLLTIDESLLVVIYNQEYRGAKTYIAEIDPSSSAKQYLSELTEDRLKRTIAIINSASEYLPGVLENSLQTFRELHKIALAD